MSGSTGSRGHIRCRNWQGCWTVDLFSIPPSELICLIQVVGLQQEGNTLGERKSFHSRSKSEICPGQFRCRHPHPRDTYCCRAGSPWYPGARAMGLPSWACCKPAQHRACRSSSRKPLGRNSSLDSTIRLAQRRHSEPQEGAYTSPAHRPRPAARTAGEAH